MVKSSVIAIEALVYDDVTAMYDVKLQYSVV